MDFHLFDSNSDISVDKEIKKEEKEFDINKIIENKLDKVQSSLTTVVGEEDRLVIEKVDVALDSDGREEKVEVEEEEAILKNKKSISFFNLFKKINYSKTSISNAHHLNSENENSDKDKENILVKDNETNFHSFFTHIKNNFKFKSNSTSEQKEEKEAVISTTTSTREKEEVFTTSSDKDKEELQQKIEIDQPIIDKMDSSLTETDILAKQISKISSSLEVTKSSTIDYTQLTSQIADSSLIPNETDNNFSPFTDNINQQKKDDQDNQITNNIIETESMDNQNHEYIDDSNKESIENNQHTTTSPKTFKPVILPIDNENDFNRVETIEIIDEYIFDSPNPILYYTNNGKEEEISEIIIEDKFVE
ncbi:hypothetical protein PIROE2DRAFT_60547 [Piromyces sp. E2]|nr:hypothetical protein PIROE2DRAFT_60547 [Piromyces sp. E2]|eukprot:OUM64587.1 hypothetical protein PIROE2DRAFT_60547 [Piromyces sp. E2]